MCSLAAAVQGMDETVNNGAQELYLKVEYLIDNQTINSKLLTQANSALELLQRTKGGRNRKAQSIT